MLDTAHMCHYSCLMFIAPFICIDHINYTPNVVLINITTVAPIYIIYPDDMNTKNRKVKNLKDIFT